VNSLSRGVYSGVGRDPKKMKRGEEREGRVISGKNGGSRKMASSLFFSSLVEIINPKYTTELQRLRATLGPVEMKRSRSETGERCEMGRRQKLCGGLGPPWYLF